MGRRLAAACGISITSLQLICQCRYVIPTFIPSWRKHKRYELDLFTHSLPIIFTSKGKETVAQYDIVLFVGKRLPALFDYKDVDFFEVHFAFWQSASFCFATIPNPLAEFWWKEPDNVKQVQPFMAKMLQRHGA